MTTRSAIRDQLYKIIVTVLSITLIFSVIPPAGWGLLLGGGIAYAAPVATNPVSIPPGGRSLSSMVQALQNALLPELANPLTSMGTLGQDGQPSEVLVDVGAMQAAASQEPISLASPLSVSRVQSAYRAADTVSSTLVVTFTVTNNRPPTAAPQLPVSVTVTDTIAVVSAFDFSGDPNTMRDVLLVDSLTDYATFVSSTPIPDRRVPYYAWNLGDIPPLGDVTVTLIVHVPTSVTGFINLDTGATAWGTFQGRSVSAQTRPAGLASEEFGDWLKWTVDADYYDEYMLAKAAELGQDPLRMFEYVRSLGYESYEGSLRGTRGTLWSEAGNSLDQASLLIAMLRGAGVPARYVHGTLSTERAQELVLSMFPTPTRIIGHIPPGTEVADPANDPQLLAETLDHWWAEAHLPGLGWTNLDPGFASEV